LLEFPLFHGFGAKFHGRFLNDYVAWPLIHTNMTSEASQAKGCLGMGTETDEKERPMRKVPCRMQEMWAKVLSPSLFSWTGVISVYEILRLVIGVTLVRHALLAQLLTISS
jgi:hypothetical protein